MKNKIIFVEILGSIETTDHYSGDLCIYKNENLSDYWEGHDTPISELERVLDEMKKMNATHFSVIHQEDHGNFVFTPSKVYPASDEQYKTEKNKMKSKKK